MSTLYSYVSCFFGFLGRLFRNVLFQLLSFVIVLFLIGVVSISYGAWTTLNREDATSGKKITSTLMQGIIDNINGLTSVINVKDGKVGIKNGTFQVESTNIYYGFLQKTISNTDIHPVFMGIRGRGDFTNITYPQTGDTLNSFVGRDAIDGLTGDGNTYGGASVYIYATENFSRTNKGTALKISTTKNGTNSELVRLTVNHDGNVGIGTASPSQKLHVIGNVLASSYLTPSDLTLKKEIKQTKGIETIKKLKGVEFKWKENNKKDLGLIAQQVEQVLPELVTTNKETNKKSINYSGLIAPLIEAVKEQQKEIEKQEEETRKQKATIEKLEKENKSYKTRLDTLEKRMQSLEGSQK